MIEIKYKLSGFKTSNSVVGRPQSLRTHYTMDDRGKIDPSLRQATLDEVLSFFHERDGVHTNDEHDIRMMEVIYSSGSVPTPTRYLHIQESFVMDYDQYVSEGRPSHIRVSITEK